MTRALQRPKKDNLEFEDKFSKATRQFRHISANMENVGYQIRRLKLYIHEEIPKELLHMPPSLCSNIIDIRLIAAAKGRFQRAFMKHAQPRQSITTKTSKNKLCTFKLGDTPDAPFTECTVLKEKCS